MVAGLGPVTPRLVKSRLPHQEWSLVMILRSICGLLLALALSGCIELQRAASGESVGIVEPDFGPLGWTAAGEEQAGDDADGEPADDTDEPSEVEEPSEDDQDNAADDSDDTNADDEGIPELSDDLEEVVSATGLRYIDIEAGEGAEALDGDTVEAHYTGWLEDGTQFDSSHDRGEPFGFTLGVGSVIAGWDEGIAGMQVGGQRRLIIPPDLAYGEQGTGNIPPDSTLTFDVELVTLGQ